MAWQVCAPWTTPDKLCCEGGGSTDDCAGGSVPLVYMWTDEEYILAASDILFAQTCFLYPGMCSATVWPCIGPCNHEPNPCACCGTYSAITLPTTFPVDPDSITVTIDGAPLDSSAYRLERGNVLVRVDGLRWQPNSFGLPNSQCAETIVSYDAGALPPIELQMAAAELACELKKACNGDDCGLTDRVTRINRRGVQMDLMDLTEMLKSGSTGLPTVDRAIAIHGNCSHDAIMDPLDMLKFGWSTS